MKTRGFEKIAKYLAVDFPLPERKLNSVQDMISAFLKK